ncbi:inositol polyphosphate multikinase-like isoform X1 [Haliotis rubra]|uniref:inositol polyphosphate multikinase-like isoform X1 n=1 Tax=Haliotis rubra TaxID=36100 RepID=UPI001EE5AC52|nr:inositol polyphosphate multikinase-like isoform X1 [Haliotis rubra]XP_046574171.1 inositol polyphosphate multikinase-like isoform X1 [Haliotis rubra]
MAMTHVEHAMAPGVTYTKFGKKRKTGVVYLGQHAILKPVHNCVSGRREVDFYTTVFQQHNDDVDDIVALRDFIPRFMGVEEKAEVRHLKLENTMSRFRKPCMIDIKMGHVTSDPLAWPEKVAQRRSKYPYAEKLGFSLSGMTLYNPDKREFETVDKYTCLNFSVDQVLVEGLGRYFGFPDNPRKDVILCLIHKLHRIRRWFLRQRQFAFYASSLLIVYEGLQNYDQEMDRSEVPPCCLSPVHGLEKCHRRQSSKDIGEQCNCSEDLCAQVDVDAEQPLDNSRRPYSLKGHTMATRDIPDCVLGSSTGCDCLDDSDSVDCSLVDVRLIDFTHAFRTTERDDNYLSGLQILINILSVMYRWG